MNIPPKYEDVVAKLDEALERNTVLQAETEEKQVLAEMFYAKQVLAETRMRNAEGREAALREEFDAYKIKRTEFAHKVGELTEKSEQIIDTLQQRLTVAEQLLRRVIACGELTRINHAELEADVCQWLGPVTPEEPVTFGPEYNNLSVAERSAMQVTARIQEVAELKPAEEVKS